MTANATATWILALTLVLPALVQAQETVILVRERHLRLYIPAVGEGPDQTLVGVASTLDLTLRSPGRGDVFVRTQPLAQLDMQGAARLAVAAAGELTGADAGGWDYFFTITTEGPIIGGPSAGAAMTVATVAGLMNWTLDATVAMTGMIDPDLSLGPVGGIYHKAEALSRTGVKTFLVPLGQSVEQTTLTVVGEDGSRSLRRTTVNITEVAQREWDLQVVEAGDVYDAIPFFTKYRIERPATDVDPSLAEAYQALMESLSREQSANATRQQDEAVRGLEGLQGDVPAGDAQAVTEALEDSRRLLGHAENATRAGRHYRSSSFSFQSLVRTRYALAVIDFHRQTQAPGLYAQAYIVSVSDDLEAAIEGTRGEYPMRASQLGAQAALELRAAEAQRALASARTLNSQGNVEGALERASFARERVGGVRWWGHLRDRLGGVADPLLVTVDALKALQEEYAGTANLMLAYAALVLEEVGASSSDLERARAALAQAGSAAAAGRDAASLFGVVEAISFVNTAVASLNPAEALAQRLHLLQDRAAYDIEAARGVGIEPVFAVSQYEFALSLVSEEPSEAYELLTFARMSAHVTLRAAGYRPPPAVVSGPAPSPLPGPVVEVLRGIVVFAVVAVGVGWVVLLVVLTAMTFHPFPGGKK